MLTMLGTELLLGQEDRIDDPLVCVLEYPSSPRVDVELTVYKRDVNTYNISVSAPLLV